MNRIVLKGGNICLTKDINTVYEVKSGEVLAYIVPLKNGETGRRLYLGNFTQGDRIPGFSHDSETYGSWRIILAGVDEAEVSILPDLVTDALLIDFALRTNLPMMKTGDGGRGAEGLSEEVRDLFGEALIEKYNRYEIRQDGYIYAAVKEKAYIREHTLKTILSAFQNEEAFRGSDLKETGNALYDAAALLCARERINISPLERIEDSSGRKFKINDIARVSHFAIREVVLDGKWFKHDCGSYLAFLEDRKHPVALIPKGPNRYVMYDPKTGDRIKVTEKLAAKILPNVYSFYRPFPDRIITVKDFVLFGMQKVYMSDIVRILLMTLFGVLVGMFIPYLNEQAYDTFIPMGNSSGLIQLGGLLIACAIGGISFTIVKNLSTFRSINTMEYAVQSAVFDRLFKLPESFFREYEAAELGLCAMEASDFFDTLSQGIVMAGLSFIFSLMYLIQMFMYSGYLTLVAIVLMGLVILAVVVMGMRRRRILKTIPIEPGEEEAEMYQFIKGISKIRMAGAEDRALDRYMEKLAQITRRAGVRGRFSNMITAMIASVPTLFAMFFYSIMVRKGIGLSVGEFSAFCAAFGAFSTALFTLVEFYLDINGLKTSYKYLRPILETLPEIVEDAGLPGELTGEIEINNVTFGYDPDQKPVINGLHLHINPGEYIGIVGSSGCGKSTLMKLLLGFEKPGMGKIYYDNQDIDGLDKRELRKKLGVVLQEGGLIKGSIYENITITSPGIKLDRVNETVKSVGLDEDINNMPMGLHTVVSEEAGTISGGQKQKILIARAMAGDPRILLFDEATSALDNTTQAQIVETLEKTDATKIVIAHRLSTVVNCDRIIVLDKGSIAEEGTYKELMDRKGLFYELAIRQIS